MSNQPSTTSKRRYLTVHGEVEASQDRQSKALDANPQPQMGEWQLSDDRYTISRLLLILSRRRSPWVLLVLSAAVGLVLSLSVLPLSLIAGSGEFWTFPRGTIPGSINDMATALVGYTYLQHGPWEFPLLFAPGLGIPTGTNVFWLDAVPWIDVLGKFAFTLFGASVNLLGFHLLLSFMLPGVAMAAVLIAANDRSILGASAAAILSDSTPWLLYRWGHIALLAQYLVIASLAFYVATLRSPETVRLRIWWVIGLAFTLLTNVYLTAMAGLFWCSSVLQRAIQRKIALRGLFIETMSLTVVLIVLAMVTGIYSKGLLQAGSGGFGWWSMNLLSPVVMQMSGLFPAASNFVVGAPGQYEGFSYFGAGVLLLLFAGMRDLLHWLRGDIRHHIMLCFMLAISLLFALSDRIYFGRTLVLDIPLSPAIAHMIGTFRSSGRFFWPVGYTALACALLVHLRSRRRGYATALIVIACCLQLIDTIPLRKAVAQSAADLEKPVLQLATVHGALVSSKAVLVFPSYSCVFQADSAGNLPSITALRLMRANLEVQLEAARANVPTNSVYNARLQTNCGAERSEESAPRRPDILYIYLDIPAAYSGLFPQAPTSPECKAHAGFTSCYNSAG